MAARITPNHRGARRSLATTLELTLDPRRAARRGLVWARVPRANREAIAEPVQQIARLLRDSSVAIPDSALVRIRALATHPASPAYDPSPTRARFLAWSLVDELNTAGANGR